MAEWVYNNSGGKKESKILSQHMRFCYFFGFQHQMVLSNDGAVSYFFKGLFTGEGVILTEFEFDIKQNNNPDSDLQKLKALRD